LDNSLPEKEFNQLFDDDVLSADLGSEISKRLIQEEEIVSYTKESGISKMRLVNKRVGF